MAGGFELVVIVRTLADLIEKMHVTRDHHEDWSAGNFYVVPAHTY